MVRPGGTVASLPHDSWTFPLDSNRSKIQRPSRSGCNADALPVGAEAADVPGPPCLRLAHASHGGSWGRGCDVGWQGTGLALCPGLQVLPPVFCLNEAGGLNVAHSLEPTAKPCCSPFPSLLKTERAHPPFPPGTVRYSTSQRLVSLGYSNTCAPSKTHQRCPRPLTLKCI